MKQEKFLIQLIKRINDAFDINVSKKKPRRSLQPPVLPGIMDESIDDYTKRTGKRFRMTKAEKDSGISREEAFKQRFTKND